MTQRTVVITDGNERAALAVVRSLGAAGYRCVVVAASKRSLAGASRFAARSVEAPDPLKAPTEFGESIAQLVREESVSLLIPISEPSMLALLPRRAHLGSCVIPFPDVDAFRAISDKQRVLEEAAALGISVPSQHVVETPDDAAATIARVVFPVVIKPARSVGEADGVRAKLGVTHANNVEELTRIVAGLPRAAFPLLLQQRVVGPGMGIFLLVWDGKVRASFAHQRLTEKPPTGGVSVDRKSVALDHTLYDLSQQLLTRFAWRGVAMIEFKTDAATGRHYLMEINGRFWGSLQLAIDAGVDFPRILASLALGDGAPAQGAYRVGVRSRWFWGQVDHVIARVRRRNAHIPPGTISTGSAIADLIFGPLRTASSEEVFRWSDPRPFIRETFSWFGFK